MDINADLGEGAGNDELIMPLISSTSIACGGHFGNENSVRNTIKLAKRYNVKLGAHLSYPDAVHFGRKPMNISANKLSKAINNQLNLFLKVCEEEEVRMTHIKAHGALYNYGSNQAQQVDVMLKLFRKLTNKPILFLQNNSLLYQKAKDEFPIQLEAFIDRRYENANQLVNRSSPIALITEPQVAWEQFRSIVFEHQVKDINGNVNPIKADTLCIHGDHSSAVDILKYIHQKLNSDNGQGG